MKIFESVLISAGMLVLTAGCTKKQDLSNVDCTTVSAKYSTDVAPIVSSSCSSAGCHGKGSGAGDFTTYNGLKSAADNGSLYSAVVDRQNMPRNGSLTSGQRAKFQCWINAGAPNN